MTFLLVTLQVDTKPTLYFTVYKPISGSIERFVSGFLIMVFAYQTLDQPLRGMKQAEAFSLVELSIVLVIIGLLTGGILSGQSLIRAAELRAITSEYAIYKTAVLTFMDKYQAYPGDMKNATKFWGENATHCNTAAPDGAVGTCNGNGNGTIETGVLASAPGEIYMFWNQLALSGLIAGSYDGIAGSLSPWYTVPGQGVPVSKISNSIWNAYSLDNTTGSSPDLYGYNYKNVIEFGGVNGGWAGQPILTPEEAWGVDKKIDDGVPSRGNVVAKFWNDTCGSADDGSSAYNDFSASYRLNDATKQCILIFRQL